MDARRFGSLVAAVTALLMVVFVDDSVAATSYEPGHGAAPVFSFEDEPLNDRMALQVNVASGNAMLSASDLEVPGTGLDLAVGRTYNSLAASSASSLGYGWRLNVGQDVTLTELSGGDIEFMAPSFFRVIFAKQGDGSFKAPTGFFASLVREGGEWVITNNQSRVKLRFNAAGQLASMTDKNGNRISLTYDASDRLSSITDTRGGISRLTYDTSGRITQLADSASSTHYNKYAYDAAGDLTTFTDADNKITRYAYDADHNLTEITDPRGNRTKIVYDAQRRATSFTRLTSTSSGPTTRFAYGSGAGCTAGTPTTITDPRNHATVKCLDSTGRTVRVIDARLNQRATTYDTDSNVTQLASGSSTSSATYLEGGRVESITTPTGGASSWEYTDPGHKFFPTSIRDANGATTRYQWQQGNLTQVTDAASKQINLTYNANGTMASSTTPKGAGLPDPNPFKTVYSYDSKGRQTRVNHPEPLGDETFSYDSLNRLRTRTDGKGQTTTYSYDQHNRVVRLAYADATSVSYEYDANGNRTKRIGATGTTTYVYDKLNRLTRETFPGGLVNEYAYDAAGNLTGLTDPGGTIGYGYDPVNNLSELTEPGGARTAFIYDTRDNRTETRYPNGVTITQDFDLSDRITRILAQKPGAAPVVDKRYNYRAACGATTCDSAKIHREDDFVANERREYAYDAVGRLTVNDRISNDGRGSRYKETFEWDANSNNIARTFSGWDYGPGSSATSSFNAANQLVDMNTERWNYDANGNLTSKVRNAGATSQVFEYNTKDQTVALDWPGEPSSRRTMTYAGADQLELTDDGEQKLEYTALGVSRVEFVSGNVRRFIRDDSGRVLIDRRSTGSLYDIQDVRGSSLARTDAAGNPQNQGGYSSFGAQDNFQTAWPGFVGGHFWESNFMKLGMRYYGFKSGVFTQQDPVQDPTEPKIANRYTYAGGDSINFVDPTGLLLDAPDTRRRTVCSYRANCIATTRNPGSGSLSRAQGIALGCAAGYAAGYIPHPAARYASRAIGGACAGYGLSRAF